MTNGVFTFRSRGFTLIELVVTMGIMTILLVAALLNTRQTSAHRQLVHTAEDIRLAIYETRSLALAPEVRKQLASDRYRFHLVSSSTQGGYSGYQILETDADPTTTDQLVRAVDFDPRFLASTPPGEQIVTDLDFSIVHQGEIIAPAATGLVRLNLDQVTGALDRVTIGVTLATGQVEIVE